MADEKIVIEIADKVAPGIGDKIRDIGEQSRAAHPHIEKLKSALKSIDISGVSKLRKALDDNTAAILRQELASQRLATESARTATASARAAAAQTQAATAAQKLATAQGRATVTSAQVAAAQDKAALAALRLTEAQNRVAERAAKSAAAQAALAAASNKTADAVNRAGLSQKQYNAAMRGVPAQITDIVVSLQGGQRPLTVLLQQGGQLKDMFGGVVPALRALGTGLLALINPFTVVVAAMIGFGIAIGMVESKMRTINGMLAQFAATGRGSIDGTFIVALRKELEMLPGVSRSAAMEVIKEFANVRNVGGPNIRAASLLVADLAAAMGTDAKTAAEKMAKALEDPTKGAIALDKELGFLTVANFKTIDSLQKAGKNAEAQAVLIDLLKGSIQGLATQAMTPLQKQTNDLGNAWQRFTGELSNSGPIKAATDLLISLLGGLTRMIEKLGELGNWKPPSWVQWMMDNGPNSWLGVQGIFGGKKNEGGATGSWGADEVTGASIRANRGRQYGQTTQQKTDAAGITGKKGGGDKAENRAAALLKINTQLQNEFKLMNMLGPEREKQQKLDQIEETLIGKKIKLNKAEAESIKEKIAAIVDNSQVAAEMGRIYDEVKGPQLQWNATITASDKLLLANKITQEEYNRVMLKGEEIISNIKDPLREFNKDLAEQLQLSKMTVEQAAIESQVMQLRNSLIAQGNKLTEDAEKAIRAKLTAIQESNTAQAAENALLGDSVNKRKAFADQLTAINRLKANPASGFTAGDAATSTNDILKGMGLDTTNLKVGMDAQVESYRQMYDQIKQLRAADLIDDQQAANLKLQVWNKQQNERLAQSQSFFSGLSQLQGSSNKKLAAIGKAAAITNAVIDTYKSATGAYAAMSAIPVVGPALGAAAAAAAIAAGMANVAQIKSQNTSGFMNGGYTGDIARNEVAGPVHGREFVFDAQSTARIGKENLESMRQGKTAAVATPNVTAGATNVALNPNIINVLDPSIVGQYLNSPDGQKVLINVIQSNPSALQSGRR